MTKGKTLLKAAAALAMAVGLAACSASEFGVTVNSDLNGQVIAENADPGDNGSAGTLTVNDSQKITVDADVTSGKVKLSFYAVEGEQSKDELPEAEEKAALEVIVDKSGKTEYQLAAGDYMLSAEAVEKFTGTVTIITK